MMSKIVLLSEIPLDAYFLKITGCTAGNTVPSLWCSTVPTRQAHSKISLVCDKQDSHKPLLKKGLKRAMQGSTIQASTAS
jgi:hypothetical protein